MKTVARFYQVVPDFFLPYLINGDDDGLSVEDKAKIDAWFNRYHLMYPTSYINIALENDAEPFFTWHNSVTDGGANCFDVIIQILE